MAPNEFDLTTKAGVHQAMLHLAAECTLDPLRFVQIAFLWGKGTLAGFSGPDTWQTKRLVSLRDSLQSGAAWHDVIQKATSAGHGVGKSCLVAWLIL